MVHKVVIRDNDKTPLKYLSDLKAFKNGMEYTFNEGVNIIVGENGCGKTTLLKLIMAYLLVDSRECSKGVYNCNINNLHDNFMDKNLLDGADVYADYVRNTFRLLHKDEKTDDDISDSGEHFFEHLKQMHSSTGESVTMALNGLFSYMFGENAKLEYHYKQLFENYPQYGKYVADHMVEGDEWTILMDEPDRNLSIDKIMQIRGILDFHKPQTQIIAVIHNPLLICYLSKQSHVNMIEMTRGYINKIKRFVKEMA